MRLVSVIRDVDAYKPNAFTPELKARWLEQLEAKVYLEVLQTANSDVPRIAWRERWVYEAETAPLAAGNYCWQDEYIRNGLPQTRELFFALADGLAVGQLLVYDGRKLWLADPEEGTETEIPTEGSGSGTALSFRDDSTELFAEPPYDTIYPAWLEAQIDLRNGEASRYANSCEVFNSYWDDYNIFIARKYAPANRLRGPRWTERRMEEPEEEDCR